MPPHPARSAAPLRSLFSALAALCFALLCLAPVAAEAQDSQGIAALVNDEVISQYDLQQHLRLFYASANLPSNQEADRALERRVLDGLIEQALKRQATQEWRISVERREVLSGLNQMAARNQMTLDQMRQFMERRGIAFATLYEQLRVQLAWDKFVQRGLVPRVVVGDDEVQDQLRRLEASKDAPRYLVREILLPREAGEDSLARANALVQQLRQGGDFALIAQQVSIAPSAAVGGDIGWVELPQLPPVLRTALGAMTPGEISDPLSGKDGFHILLLLNKERYGEANPLRNRFDLFRVHISDKTGARGQDEPEITRRPPAPNWRTRVARIWRTLTGQNPAPAADASEPPRLPAAQTARLDESLRALKAQFQDCQSLPALADSLGITELNRVGVLPLGQLGERYRQLVGGLQKGEISEPLRDRDGYEVFVVCDRADDVGVELNSEMVRRNLFSNRIQMAEAQRLRSLRRRAVIEYRLATLAPE